MQISKKCIWKVGLSGLLIMCTPCCFSRSCEVNNRRPYVETTSVHDLLPHTKPCAGFSWILVYVFLIKSCREGRLAYWQSCFTLGRTWISPLFAKFFKGVVWGLVSVTPPPPPPHPTSCRWAAQFREIWYRESHSLPKSTSDFFPQFLHFLSFWIKFGIGGVHKSVMSVSFWT